MSRTVGAPFGPNPWVKEDIGFPDVLSTDLEGFIVLGCAALLIGRAWRRTGRWTGDEPPSASRPSDSSLPD